MGRFLSERTQFRRVPPFAGVIEYHRDGSQPYTLAMLQGFVPNEGDGWQWTMEELDRYYERSAHLPFPSASDTGQSWIELSERETLPEARDHLGIYLESAALLGRRTAEMHLALASDTQDPDFAPEPLAIDALRVLSAELREHGALVFDSLKENLPRLPDEIVELAGLALSRRRRCLDRFKGMDSLEMQTRVARIHGDYHLGQILRTKNDFVILDFEGEPGRPLEERRRKHSPLKDVAGMLRSFSYAAYAGLLNYDRRRPDYFETLEPWARLWEQSTAAEFLRAYRNVAGIEAFIPPDRLAFSKLLDAYLLDKALYELRYEMNTRPNWVRIPLWGILSQRV